MSAVCGMSSSLYSSGEIIIANPLESSSVLLVVVLLCACMEYLFTLAGEIKGKFFHQMFDTISEEILVVGVLSLLLSFGSSIPSSIPASWCIMLQWTHVCLLFMGVFFVLMLVSMVFVMHRHHTTYRKFEINRISNKAFELNTAELSYKHAYQQFRLCCQAYSIQEDLELVCFSDYVLKTEKEQLVTVGDLTWRSWLGLTVMVVINASRTRVPALIDALGDQKDTVDIATFIFFMGMVPMLVFLKISSTLSSRLSQFLDKRGVTSSVAARERETLLDDPLLGGGADGAGNPDGGSAIRPSDLEDPRSFLLWQTPETTLAILQMVFLAIVWYGAVFCLNMLYVTFTLPSIYLTLLFVISCLIPVFVLTMFLPRTLFNVALLSSLGSCFNEARVRGMIMVARGETVDVVGTNAVSEASKNPTRGSEVTEGAVIPRVLSVKKPPPPLLIDDQSLYRLANSSAAMDRELL
jgi:hypothetical protein